MSSLYTKLSTSRDFSSLSRITLLLLQDSKTVFLFLGDGKDKQLARIPSKMEGGSGGLSLPQYETNELQLGGKW